MKYRYYADRKPQQKRKNDTIIGKIAYGEKDRQHGSQGYAVNKVIDMMRETIKKTSREEPK